MLEKPVSPENVAVYLDCNGTNRKADGNYSWLTRYLISNQGLDTYLQFTGPEIGGSLATAINETPVGLYTTPWCHRNETKFLEENPARRCC